MLANDPDVTELHALYCDEMLARMKAGPRLSNLGSMYDVARARPALVVQGDAADVGVVRPAPEPRGEHPALHDRAGS